MSESTDAFDAAFRESLLVHGLPPGQLDEVVAYMVLLPGIAAWRAQENFRAAFDQAVAQASAIYRGSDGRIHLIKDMPNGHLHNACSALKRKRLGGVDVFTILAMDAEIARREAEAPKKEIP